MEGFCGKSCDGCTWREEHGCPGCQTGPGRPYTGECDIASCCREKGHESCTTCRYLSSGCGKHRGAENAPQDRQRREEQRLQREQARKHWMDENAPVLGKWLWVMFWLVIPNGIAAIMTNRSVVELAPGLRMPGEILSLACNLICGLILLQLRHQNERYRTAALGRFAAVGLSLVTTLLIGDPASPGRAGLALLILLPALAVGLYVSYEEYHAHSEVLYQVDDELSEKWVKLWKLEVGFLLGTLGSLVLVLISGILGLLVMLGVAIGLAVVGIMKLVYLYRTAKLFREQVQR